MQSALWLLNSQSSPSMANSSPSNGLASASNTASARSAVTPSNTTGTLSASTSTSSTGSLTVGAQVSDGQVVASAEGDADVDTSLYSSYQDFVAENAQTSQQLSVTAYSGAALASDNVASGSQTFLQAVGTMYTQDAAATSMAQQMIAWVAQGRPATGGEDPTSFAGMTDAQVIAQANGIIANAANGNEVANAITSAYDSKTLTVQNADQVQGLNFEESFSETDDNGSTTSTNNSLNFNKDFLSNNPDGQQHALVSFGDTYAYLTW